MKRFILIQKIIVKTNNHTNIILIYCDYVNNIYYFKFNFRRILHIIRNTYIFQYYYIFVFYKVFLDIHMIL